MIAMADAFGNALSIAGDLSKGIPDRLAGFPIYFTWRLPALGTEGDLIFVDRQPTFSATVRGPSFEARNTSSQGIADHRRTGRESRRRTLGQGKNHHG